MQEPELKVVSRSWSKPADERDAGRRVYTPHGPAFILKEDAKNERYLVEVEETKEVKDLSYKAVRWKAIDDGYREHYHTDNNVRTPKGSVTVNCGDVLAAAIAGLDDEENVVLASANHIDYSRWDHLNRGMAKMNLSNILRRRLKNGERVVDYYGEPIKA